MSSLAREVVLSSKTALPPPVRVTFFGDSVCVGQGVSIYRGWVTRIAQFLDEYGGRVERDILVTNSSINGRTTRQALEDMPYHVQSSGVDVLVVQFGLNDCNYWATDRGVPRVSRAAFVANLHEIVGRAIRFGATHVLLNTNHPTARDIENVPHAAITYEQSNRDYNEAVREVAQDLAREIPNTIMFQDIAKHIDSLCRAQNAGPADFVLPDGLHLNDRGHAAYYDIMCPALVCAVNAHLGKSES